MMKTRSLRPVCTMVMVAAGLSGMVAGDRCPYATFLVCESLAVLVMITAILVAAIWG